MNNDIVSCLVVMYNERASFKVYRSHMLCTEFMFDMVVKNVRYVY